MSDMMRIVFVAMFCVLMAACASEPQSSITALPPAPPKGEPSGVAGMAASQLRVAYGAPVFVRKDGIVEMWRYENAKCKAFFFLYPEGSELSVRHVETIPHSRNEAADPACLNALRASPPVS